MQHTDDIILVDSNNVQTGTGTKDLVHRDGLLHRAVSVLVFDNRGRFLLQRRSKDKYHCAGLWANTCCSHPFPGETAHQAATRRLKEEMGIITQLQPLFEFVYKAQFDNGLTEYEYDHVFAGICSDEPVPNPCEVAEYKWQRAYEIEKMLQQTKDQVAPWFKIIFEQFKGSDYWNFYTKTPGIMDLGYCPSHENSTKHLIAARVSCQLKHNYTVICEKGEFPAEIAGKMLFKLRDRSLLPAVGDWVMIKLHAEGKATIHEVLPRRTTFSRREPGRSEAVQMLAANIDFVFIICSADREINLRRIERYMAVVLDGGAQPVIIVNKCDIEVPQGKISELRDSFPAVPVILSSALTGTGIDELKKFFSSGVCAVLMGSSGVGKSSILNRIAGIDFFAIGEVREKDGKGRHTTTYRELAFVPGGGMIIDTPGIREIQLDIEEISAESFADIEELALSCRFRNCSHNTEPGCAVKDAVESGALNQGRYANYLKMKAEIEAIPYYKRKKTE